MHMVIRAIVYAQNKEDALSEARNVFERLSGERGEFDYFTMFDEEGSPVSGKGRWGNITPVALATSKEGQKLIKEGTESTWETFNEMANRLRKEFSKHTNKELFSQEFGGDWHYPANCIGEYRGSNTWLYDKDGEGIRDEKHLSDALSNWKEGLKNGQKAYVIPADVHL